ncbi:hypothetical protein D3C77_529270 [compost metagenome]
MVGRALRVQLPEVPLAFLGVRQQQRLATIGWQQRRLASRRLFLQAGGKGTQGGVLEQMFEWHLHVQCLTQARHHLGRQQRVATQGEEIILSPHLR